jgi:hypothetical protein
LLCKLINCQVIRWYACSKTKICSSHNQLFFANPQVQSIFRKSRLLGNDRFSRMNRSWIRQAIRCQVAPNDHSPSLRLNPKIVAFWKVCTPPLIRFECVQVEEQCDQTSFDGQMLLGEFDFIIVHQVAHVMVNIEEFPR